MSDTSPSLLFGISIDPSASDPEEPFRRARLADEAGLDMITLMDHPYNKKLFDTWTLLTALGLKTERVHVGTNVANLPLRPPAMLAKMAASLDVLTGGRMELGIGAGGYWEGIAAFGGPQRTSGEAYRAFKEAIHIIRGLWENPERSFTHKGDIYKVRGARFGPAPAHRIRIWSVAYGPQMLRLTGRMADGLLVSYNYAKPEKLSDFNAQIDGGAAQAGRNPSEIRRGYNLMGVLDIGREDTNITDIKDDYVSGSVRDWTDKIVTWHEIYRQDTFIFWPIAGNQLAQIEAFAQEVVPAVRETLMGN